MFTHVSCVPGSNSECSGTASGISDRNEAKFLFGKIMKSEHRFLVDDCSINIQHRPKAGTHFNYNTLVA